jgi:cbb3-type cytochrome oxidase maturation protein
MDEATIALTLMSFLVLLIFLGFLVWGIKSGQFKSIEDAKYRIFQDGQEPEGDKKEGAGEDRNAV